MTANMNVPACVGVPDKAPVNWSIARPDGRAPVAIDQFGAASAGVAVSVAL